MSGVIDHVNVQLILDSLLLNNLDLDSAQDPLVLALRLALSNGTGTGQASQVWHDKRTLGPSATENLDLAGGGLLNAFGVSLTFTKVKMILVRARDTNNAANNVNFQRGAANGAPIYLANSDGVSLSPGGIAFQYDPIGWTITPGTGDILTVTNSAGTNSVDYDIIIVGTD